MQSQCQQLAKKQSLRHNAVYGGMWILLREEERRCFARVYDQEHRSKKGKTLSVNVRTAPEGSGRLNLQISRESAHEGARLSTLSTGRLYPPPSKYPWYSFLLEAESTPGSSCGRNDTDIKFEFIIKMVLVNNQIEAKFFTYVYFYSLHVSGIHVPIIRRIIVSVRHLVYVTPCR